MHDNEALKVGASRGGGIGGAEHGGNVHGGSMT